MGQTSDTSDYRQAVEETKSDSERIEMVLQSIWNHVQ